MLTIKHRNSKKAISLLKELRRKAPGELWGEIDRVIFYVEQSKWETEIAVEYITQMLIRNSEFDGDWVGRPDDDFKD
jgi:hypothetical protein